jgi:hypothetical protein
MTARNTDIHLRALPGGKQESTDNQVTRRRGAAFDRFLPHLAVVATVGLLTGAVARQLTDGTKSTGLSVQQLRNLPDQVDFTPTQSQAVQGASAIGEAVDPGVYQGPNSNTTTADNLNKEIAEQDLGGFIHAGEHFKVPYIPPPGPTK